MTATDNFGTFFKENKKLAKEYLDTRLEILRLRFIRIISKVAGNIIWIIISLFFFFMFFIFIGLTAGFWLTDLTGSYVKGFGIVTGILFIIIMILAIFRRTLFINPVIRAMVRISSDQDDEAK